MCTPPPAFLFRGLLLSGAPVGRGEFPSRCAITRLNHTTGSLPPAEQCVEGCQACTVQDDIKDSYGCFEVQRRNSDLFIAMIADANDASELRSERSLNKARMPSLRRLCLVEARMQTVTKHPMQLKRVGLDGADLGSRSDGCMWVQGENSAAKSGICVCASR